MNISVIGGADGPTSVFVAGKLSDSFSATIIISVIVLLIVAAIVLLIKKKRT